jgi:hypothetical protein
MRYLPWTDNKTLYGKYSPVQKFFKKWKWNCGILHDFEYQEELYRYFYEFDDRTPEQRLFDDEFYID